MFNIIRAKIAARYARKAQVLIESWYFDTNHSRRRKAVIKGLNLIRKSFAWMPRDKEYNEFWGKIRTMTTDFLVKNKEIFYKD